MHNDLLDQARKLLTLEPKKPRQVSLRRAVSTAYYALFHRLIAYSVTNTVGGGSDATVTAIRGDMSRWFSHAQMKKTSAWFARRGNVPENVRTLLRFNPQTQPFGIVPQGLVDVAVAFVRLQEERHRADYDLSYRLTRTQAEALVTRAQRAFSDLESVSGEAATKLYALLMLAGDKVITDR